MKKLWAAFIFILFSTLPLHADLLCFYAIQNNANRIDFRDAANTVLTGNGSSGLGIELGTQLYPGVDWFLGFRYNSTRSFSPSGSYDSNLLYYKMRWNFIASPTFSAFVGGLAGFDFSSQQNFPGGVNADVGAAWGLLAGIKLFDSFKLETGHIWMFPTFRNTSGSFAAVFDELYLQLGYEMNFDFVGWFKR